MKFITAIFFLACLFSSTAWAGQAEVRNVALLNNCTPKKIDVYKQNLGAENETVYQVTCTLPKAVGPSDEGAKPADAILVSCKMNLCEMLRPITLEKK